MKTAIDRYERGKQREANADDYDRRYSYSSTRFICPECGEFVHLTGSVGDGRLQPFCGGIKQPQNRR